MKLACNDLIDCDGECDRLTFLEIMKDKFCYDAVFTPYKYDGESVYWDLFYRH